MNKIYNAKGDYILWSWSWESSSVLTAHYTGWCLSNFLEVTFTNEEPGCALNIQCHWIVCLTIYLSQYQPLDIYLFSELKRDQCHSWSGTQKSERPKMLRLWKIEEKKAWKETFIDSARLALSISNHIDVCLLQKAYAFAMTPATKLARVVGDNFKFWFQYLSLVSKNSIHPFNLHPNILILWWFLYYVTFYFFAFQFLGCRLGCGTIQDQRSNQSNSYCCMLTKNIMNLLLWKCIRTRNDCWLQSADAFHRPLQNCKETDTKTFLFYVTKQRECGARTGENYCCSSFLVCPSKSSPPPTIAPAKTSPSGWLPVAARCANKETTKIITATFTPTTNIMTVIVHCRYMY